MASYRHSARIAVMQALFAYEFRGGEPEKILKYSLKEFAEKVQETEFAEKILRGVLEHQKDIRKLIQEEAPEWPIDKIAPVDRAILEIGLFELLHSKDVPAIVAINEAVEIAKSFGDTNSPKFINGVLSTLMHKYRPEAETNPKVATKS